MIMAFTFLLMEDNVMSYMDEYKRWVENVKDEELSEALKKMDETQAEDAFYRDLAFGTGGLRGTIGAGTNRMNIYTVAKASQGLSDYLVKSFTEPSVAIGYDQMYLQRQQHQYLQLTELRLIYGLDLTLFQQYHLQQDISMHQQVLW